MNITTDQFKEFCRLFQEHNESDFDEKEIEFDTAIDGVLYYNAIYRDPYNYKSPVRISLCDGVIEWDVIYGFEDAYEELDELYNQFIESLSGR